MGQDGRRRARRHPQQDRRPHRGRTSSRSRVAETWDNGKPIRETLDADLPLAVDHFRYFAGAIRAQEGSLSPDRRGHRRLPLPRAARRRRPDHPVELPDPDGHLEARPGAGRRQRRRAQAGRADPGVDPVSDGAHRRPAARRACSTSSTASGSRPASRWRRRNRIAKIAFTGETTTGRLIMQYASQNLIPVTLELGGKSPNIFFDDVMAARRRLPRQGAGGLHDVRPQPGRGLHLPVARPDPGRHLRRVPGCAAIRTKAVRQGNPLDTDTMIGAQASNDQLEKILSYIEIGKAGGRPGAHRRRARRPRRRPVRRLLRAADHLRGQQHDADLPGGDLRPGRRGDVASTDYDDAITIANDTLYGLGAGVWTRDGNTRLPGRAATSRPAGCGRTATTPTRRTRRSAATSSPASAGRTTR